MTPRQPLGLSAIFRFWFPLAGTWLMMSVESPLLAALIARLDSPKQNLAAFGVVYAVAILIEAPVIMILSASTALVDGPHALRKLRRFTYALNLAVTAAILGLLLTPAWMRIAGDVIGLPEDVTQLTWLGLALMVPWPAAVGYRRFYQGLLIRQGSTRLVAYGTVLRMTVMATTGVGLFAYGRFPGVVVGAAATSAGVCAEAVVGRLMARRAVREIRSLDGPTDLTYRAIVRFYYPLALTSVISLAAHPMVTFFMGHARNPLESLAVLPVVNSLSFIFRSLGLSYQEIAITLLARGPENRGPVLRFAAILAMSASASQAAIAFTPLAHFWLRDLSGLSAELAGFALPPLQILAIFPALSVLLSLQRAILVHTRATGPITWATLIEIGGIIVALIVGIATFDLVGATAAALAFLTGRVAANLFLLPPCAKSL